MVGIIGDTEMNLVSAYLGKGVLGIALFRFTGLYKDYGIITIKEDTPPDKIENAVKFYKPFVVIWVEKPSQEQITAFGEFMLHVSLNDYDGNEEEDFNAT